MRILIVGATGMIGREVVRALSGGNEIVPVSQSHTPIAVDLVDGESIRKMYKQVGKVDAVISAAGNARFKPLAQLTDEDFNFSLMNKLMGQVNVIRFGFEYVADRGSITVTGGVLGRSPMVGAAAISLVNAGLEGFVRGAALEAPRNIRVNVVSPPWVSETLKAMGQNPANGLAAAVVARSYVESVKGKQTGVIIEPS